MSPVYSVLYVDDEPGLLEIAKLFLEQSEEFRVGTSASAKAALDSAAIRSCDVIVSDYQMPGMDGIAFLKEVRQRYGDIPFILFTGRGREEVVIDAINNGADFYLQKGGDPAAQFAELGHKIRQAVARKRAEFSLVESEKRLSDIINFLPDATFAIDRAGHVIAWNRAIEEMTGVPAADMLGKGDYAYAVPFYQARRKILIDLIFEPDEIITRDYAHIVHDKDILIADTTVPRPRGRAVTLMGKASPLYNRRGEIVGAIESIRDISGLKNAEENLSRAKKDWETIFRAVGHPAVILDCTNRIIDANDATLEVTGKSLDELKGKHCFTVFHAPGTDRPPHTCPFEQLKKNGISEPQETEIETLNGYYTVNCTPVFDAGGRLEKVIHIAMDVTGRRQAEDNLRAAYDRLAASDEELREQYDTLAESELRIRENELRLTYMLGFYEMAEQPEKALLSYAVEGAGAVTGSPLGYLAFLNDDETMLTMYAWSRTAMEECVMQKKPITYPVEKTGLWGEAVRQRRPVITNDYQAPDSKKKGYPEGHPHIISHMNVPVFDGSRIVIMAGVANNPSGYTENEVRELTLLMQGLWQVLKVRRAEEELRAANEQLTVSEEELRGQYEDLAAVEQRIRESETRFRDLAGLLPQVIFEMDRDLKVTYANQSAFTMIGLDAGDLTRGTDALSFIDPEQRGRARRALESLVRGEPGQDYEFTVLRKDGSTFPALIYAAPVYRSGTLDGFRGVIVDISVRKKTEEALRESEAKYRTVVEQSNDAIFIAQEGVLVFHNPALAAMTGYTDAELAGRPIADLIAPEDRDLVLARHRERLRGKDLPGTYEFSALHRDGVQRIRVIMHISFGAFDGKPATIGTIHDVTGERRREAALQESEEQFRRLISGSFDAVIVHQEGRIVLANERAARILGVASPDQFIGRPVIDLVHPDYRSRVRQRMEELGRLPSGSAPLIEEKFTRFDGTPVDVEVMATTSRHGGRPAVMVVFRDISDRKKTETELQAAYSNLSATEEKLRSQYEELATSREQLRVSEEKYRRITDNARDMIYRMSLPDGRYEYVSPASAELTGYSPEEFYADPGFIRRLIHPAWQDYFRQQWDALLNKNVPPSYEYQIVDRSGKNRWFNQRNVLITGGDGQPAAIEGIVTDITERRQAEEALRMANRKLNLLSSTTRHDILNKISVILGFLKIVQKKTTDPAIGDYLNKITANTAAIKSEIDFTRVYQDLGTHDPQWIALDSVMPGAHVPAAVSLEADLQGISVFADLMLEKVFYNLLDNAVRHGEHVTEIRVFSRTVNGDLVIVWEDNGAGVAAGEKEQIFERGFGKNNGFGLFLAREILSITSMAIRETGEPGSGARFEITVPAGGWRVT